MIMPPGRIELWPLARLRPYARNAKTHDADQVAKIAASMAEFGWTVPCLVAADGELIAGHGRVLAAAQLGRAEAPVIVLGHQPEAQRRAYRIADNKLTEMGEWDEDVLRSEVALLLAEEFDLGLLGMPDDELAVLMGDGTEGEGEGAGSGGGGGDEEETPEPPADPLSEATEALQQLGYKPAEAARMAKAASAEGDAAEAIIRKALQSALR